jgi:hypothetical protein
VPLAVWLALGLAAQDDVPKKGETGEPGQRFVFAPCGEFIGVLVDFCKAVVCGGTVGRAQLRYPYPAAVLDPWDRCPGWSLTETCLKLREIYMRKMGQREALS